MKIKSIFKLILILGSLAVVVGSGPYYLGLNRSKTTSYPADKSFGWKFPVAKFPLTGSYKNLIAYSDIRDPGGIPQGLPVRLQIPIIGVDSVIEDALITFDGRMDVPAGSVNVAWFALGPHPGQTGSAVIGGHFGISNGVPFVFYNLDKLKPGDKIYIVDDKNNTLAFKVRRIESFARNADSTTVFTSNDGLAHLNLITCEGVWNQINGTYPLRLVIFTDAIPTEGAIVVNRANTAAAAITTESTPTKMPAPPVSLINQGALPTSPQILIASAKSLYSSPLDGIITSFLLFSIVFMTLKIVRR